MKNYETRPVEECIDQAGRKVGVGKLINVDSFSQSSYLPSFIDSSQSAEKRTIKLSRNPERSLPVHKTLERRRHSNTDVPSLLAKGNLTLSPTMNGNVSKTTAAAGPTKRASLGFSNGPVTSSLSLNQRRTPRSISLQAEGNSNLHHRVRGDGLHVRSTNQAGGFFNIERPSAPLHSEAPLNNQLATQSEKISTSKNTLSLGNWLSSLPDTSVPEGTQRPLSSDSSHPKEMEVKEIEDFEDGFGCIDRPASRLISQLRKGEPISLEKGRELKKLMFAQTGLTFTVGWIGQAFSFNSNPDLRYGLVQSKGGPCGVLAVVQGYLMKVLMYGSQQFNISRVASPLSPEEEERNEGLAVALSEILVKCADRTGTNLILAVSGGKQLLNSAGGFKTDGVTETLTLHRFDHKGSLYSFIRENIGYFTGQGNNSVVSFVYSCLLTRGVEKVHADMDSPDTALMAAHGYCSQEMVNLLLTGQASSNVFDNQIELGSGTDSTLLKGIQRPSEIGLLTLYEHYQSCSVGKFLKNPLHPIWLICSESHFSVMFMEGEREKDTEGSVQLVYYDGLGRQDNTIRLSVHLQTERHTESRDSPIEHCLRTKWPGAYISWEGTEPIL